VLTHDIFDALRDTEPGAGGEIQLTDAINQLAKQQAFYEYRFDHGRYDVGNKLDYLKATVEFALERDDIGEDFRRYLQDLMRDERLR
jgi:UTP--glucose-1-phosphate uridylyltransferase